MCSSNLIGAAAVMLLLGCRPTTTVCTANPHFAVTVRVRDANTLAPAAYGATLVLRDGEYVDSVTGTYAGPNPEQASLLGAAEERAGTYEVTIRKEGYQPWTRQGIVVRQGECGVDGATLEVLLVPSMQ
jgi:hypothetical protein